MKKRTISTGRLHWWLGCSLLAVSFQAQAGKVESSCRYDHLPQESVAYMDIRLIQPDSKIRDWRPYETESGETMPTWLVRFDPDHVYADSAEMHWRKARLLHNEFKENGEGSWGNEETIRYYSAFTEHCEEIFLRIPVEHLPFSRQLEVKDDRSDGSLAMSPLQNALDMIIEEDWVQAQSHVGKPVMVVPNPESGVTMLSEDRRQKAYAVPFTWFKVTGVSRHSLALGEEKLANFHLLVEDVQGKVWRMPWQPDRFYLGNPFSQKDVRKQHHEAIREGRLVEGMNRAEVRLVAGDPLWERRYPIYRDEHGNRRFVVDEGYRKDGLTPNRRHLPPLEASPIGEEMGWFYPDIMGETAHLRFNENGFLDFSGQPRGSRQWLSHNWLERYIPR